MQPIPIKCPHCSHSMEYWTVENYILCPKCNKVIEVKPCTEELSFNEIKEVEK